MSGETTRADKGKIRDADRSRGAILHAASELFAENGFDVVSLGQIASAAGLSRGAPSYFFGSKAALYEAVLERVFDQREEATRRACGPLVSWASSETGGSIEPPLVKALEGYLDFLSRQPAFLKLIQREELAGASRLRNVRRESRAIEEAFQAVRAVAGRRGLKSFEVKDAVLVFVSLTFFPAAQRSTLMASLGRGLDDARVRRKHVQLAANQLLCLIGSR